MPSRSHKYKCAWGTYVKYLLENRGISEAEFAHRLKLSSGQVNQYTNGRSKPPLGELSRWAEALRCTHEEQERLCWLALEPWTPTPVWTKIRELEEIISDGEASLARLAAELADLRAQRGHGGSHPPSADQQPVQG